MNKIDFKKQNIPFTQVANDVLTDPEISAGAKGIYAYLYSKPDGWDFSEKRISDDFSNGRFSVSKFLKELERNGYLKRYKLSTGRMIYMVIFPPIEPKSGFQTLDTKKPKSENCNLQKPQLAVTRPISNKEGEVIKSINNKDSEATASQVLIPEMIKLFESINPNCKTYYGNTTQRNACEFLIEEYGFERVKNVVQNVLPKTNEIEFISTITTPVQLKEKWVRLEVGIKKHKSKLQNKGRGIA